MLQGNQEGVPNPSRSNWFPWLILLILVPLIFWGTPLFAILVGAGLSLILNRPLVGDGRIGRFALQSAIVLLGFTLDALDLWEISQDFAGIIAAYVFVSLVAGIALGKLLKVDSILAQLIAAGTSICGGTAIAALGPVLKAKADQVALALAIVFFLNMIALLIFPFIGHWLGMSQTQFGMWVALAIHDTSSVLATADTYGQGAVEIAATLKLGRTLWLIPLILGFNILSSTGMTRIRLPGFIAAFVLASVLGSVLRNYTATPDILFETAQQLSKALIVSALFFIGLECTRETTKKLRGKVIWLALLLWAGVVPITLLIALNH
mgnify:CR=1 FL=1